MLKLPLRYEGDKLVDSEGVELPREAIIARMSVFPSLALAASLLELHCPRPAMPLSVREDVQVAMDALRRLPDL